MPRRRNRRRFLQQAAAAAGAPWAGAASWAAEPIRRNGTPKFKFSLAAYSYRNLLTGEQPSLTLHDFVDECARMQLDGTELTSYYFPAEVTTEYLRSLQHRCFRLGLDISGTAVGNDFGHPPGEERDRQLRQLREWIDRAALLGAPVIRVFAGHRHGDATPAQTHAGMVSAFEESCQYAGRRGVYLALENHGGPTATVDGLLALVRDVRSPWFGVNLDTGNFHSDDIYGDLARAAPYAVNVQVKVEVAGPDGQRRPTDFSRLAVLLREAGYRGYIVLEYEGSADPRQACPEYVERLREAFL